MCGDNATWKDPYLNGGCVSTSGRTGVAEVNRHSRRNGIGDLGRRSYRMAAPLNHPSDS
jgi:hypothetical protein